MKRLSVNFPTILYITIPWSTHKYDITCVCPNSLHATYYIVSTHKVTYSSFVEFCTATPIAHTRLRTLYEHYSVLIEGLAC